MFRDLFRHLLEVIGEVIGSIFYGASVTLGGVIVLRQLGVL